jgi:cytochrome c2
VGDVGDVVEDANDDRGTPSFLFLGLVVSGVLLLFWLLVPRVTMRLPIGEYSPEADPAVDTYGVVDKSAGTYRVPVAVVAAAVVADPGLLAPIAPVGGFVEVDTSTPEGQGQALFSELTCNACHSTDGPRLVGPTLQAVFGRTETLADGSEIVVDDAYLAESISDPMAKVVEGYPPAMVLPRAASEEEVAQLVAYLKTL